MPASGVIFNGDQVKTLKDKLKLNEGAAISYGTADPTSTATLGTIGDVYIRTGTPNIYQKITTSATDTNWRLVNVGSADVTGPASSLDNEVVRFDGTTGKIIQAGGTATLSDGGTLTLIGTATSGTTNYLFINNNTGTQPTIDWTRHSGDAGLRFRRVTAGVPTELFAMQDDGSFYIGASMLLKTNYLQRVNEAKLIMGTSAEPAYDMTTTSSARVYSTMVRVPILNAGVVGITVKGAASQTANLQNWTDSASVTLASITSAGVFTAANISGTNTGDVTLAAIGSTPNANAASLSGQVLTLQPADGSFGGILTTGTQTIAGAKTFSTSVISPIFSSTAANPATTGQLRLGNTQFIAWRNAANTADLTLQVDAGNILQIGMATTVSGAITASNLAGTNTGDLTLAAIGSTPNANAASLSGQVLTLQPADGSFGGILTTGTQTIAGAKTFSTSVTSPIFSSSTANPATTGVLRLANTDTIGFRNAANSANHTLSLDASNIFQLTSALTITGALVTSGAISTTLTTDSTSITTGSIITAGGLGVGKSIVAGVAASIHKFAGTLKLISDDVSIAGLYLPRYSTGSKFTYVVAGNSSGTPVECGLILQTVTSGLGVIEPLTITGEGAFTIGANGTTPTHRINIGVSSTVGAAGAASALPATPEGYIVINVGGTDRKIPYYLT